jgi:hypothetical protein
MTKTFEELHEIPDEIDATRLEKIIKQVDSEWLINQSPDAVLYNGYAIAVLVAYLAAEGKSYSLKSLVANQDTSTFP